MDPRFCIKRVKNSPPPKPADVPESMGTYHSAYTVALVLLPLYGNLLDFYVDGIVASYMCSYHDSSLPYPEMV